jgi:flagellar basal body L-ring protein FlgH
MHAGLTTHQTKYRKCRLTTRVPYDQLYKQNSATNSSGNVNQNRSKSLPLLVSSTIIDTELIVFLNVTVSKCKQTMTTGLKAAPLRLEIQALLQYKGGG